MEYGRKEMLEEQLVHEEKKLEIMEKECLDQKKLVEDIEKEIERIENYPVEKLKEKLHR